MSQLFNTLSRFVIAFLPSKQVSSTFTAAVTFVVILEPKKIQSVIVSTLFPSICHEVTGLDAMVLVFLMLDFKPAVFTLLFHFHQEAL